MTYKSCVIRALLVALVAVIAFALATDTEAGMHSNGMTIGFHGRPFAGSDDPPPPPRPLEEETVFAQCFNTDADAILTCVRNRAPIGTTSKVVNSLIGKPIGRMVAYACATEEGKAAPMKLDKAKLSQCLKGEATVHVLGNLLLVVGYVDDKVHTITYRQLTPAEIELGAPPEWQ